ncbi:MAG: hypothetical protein EOO02_06735 [Chitinophagaceae bacterium]|nr:MAG: hypothetical protein EOO02_06735 [Chitinophagaceae bacterium]
MFGIYLILNGLERFLIELMRVNKTYPVFGMRSSQAEIIALTLVLIGIMTILIARKKFPAIT